MKVSLIVTTYNNHLSLKKATDSILRQTLIPEEVLIADDGSDEHTASVVKMFSAAAPFPVIHIRQKNLGFRAAKIRNEAIKHTSGDYIILLDGDCVVNKHFISDHVFLSEKNCFIQGKRIHVGKDSVVCFTHDHANSFVSLMKLGLKRKISNIHHIIRFPVDCAVKNRILKGIKSCNMSFFKEDIIAVNGFNEDFIGWGNEDSELAYRLFRHGLKKKIHSFMAICYHLWHPTNKRINNSNQELLATALNSKDHRCVNGLIKQTYRADAEKERAG